MDMIDFFILKYLRIRVAPLSYRCSNSPLQNFFAASGRILCSTSSTRADSVSGVSSGRTGTFS